MTNNIIFHCIHKCWDAGYDATPLPSAEKSANDSGAVIPGLKSIYIDSKKQRTSGILKFLNTFTKHVNRKVVISAKAIDAQKILCAAADEFSVQSDLVVRQFLFALPAFVKFQKKSPPLICLPFLRGTGGRCGLRDAG